MYELLDVLFLQPLMVIYQALFRFPDWLSTGGQIIAFAIMLNLLLSPVYRQMEVRARLDRQKREPMAREVARMKANFRGRERYFYVQVTHRQYRYHPIQALITSNELFLQIFVFASVFHFLSSPGLLNGATFGPIADLSQPDGLLGTINFLPLLMTAVNIMSVLCYIKERNQRLQAIALALVFLVLLYPSPAGLVLYWTINNCWSLLRNMISRAT